MPKARTPRSTTAPTKPVITMPEAGSTPTMRKSASPANPTPINMESMVRQRAYEIYQERGCTPGRENDDWLQAESEIRAQNNQQQRA